MSARPGRQTATEAGEEPRGARPPRDPVEAVERAVSTLPIDLGRVLDAIALRLRGEAHEDRWGFDEQLAEALFPLAELLYERWWRVEAEGVANVPAHGRALIVANRAGGLIPFDAAMISTAIMKLHPLPRWPRFVAIDWLFTLPFASDLVRRLGGVPSNQANPEGLLEADEIVMSFPEGMHGIRKPFSERYRLQRFGRGGFVETALRTRAPILPVSIVGSEEIYPKLGESAALARLTGAPYVPITPTFPWLGPLGLVPMPSRWRIEFGEPIDLSEHGPEAADDRRLVFDIAEQVRERIQASVYENLVKRGSAFI